MGDDTKKRIAIFSIFTGNYSVFYKQFVKSIAFDFLPECDKHFFICTDKELPNYKCVRGKVTQYVIDDMPFPYITLLRYKIFNEQINDAINDYDYVFFLNSNARCFTQITCSDINLENDYTFTLHDNHLDESIDEKPFERNAISTAQFSDSWVNPEYVGGRFFGAKPDKFKEMFLALEKNVEKDLENDFISIWHDESHLNWFYNTHKENLSHNLLSVNYHVQEQHGYRDCFTDKKMWYVDKNKRRYKKLFIRDEFLRYKLTASEIITTKKIALLVSIFYPKHTEKIIEYINRVPFKCDVYLSCKEQTDYEKFFTKCNKFHTIIKVEYPDGGMDLHPFVDQIRAIKENGENYDYYLKIHSKNNLRWAKSMFESVLPYSNYEVLFNQIDEYNVCGSDFYLFNFSNSHANKDLILEQINKFQLNISESDVWDTLKENDDNATQFDVDFYIQYHNDLHSNSLSDKNQNKINKKVYEDHWEKHGNHETGRVPHGNFIIDNAPREFKFYAGTIFWFNQTYLDYLLKNLDELSEVKSKLKHEVGNLKNVNTTYTHHLEYWVGLLASNLVYPKILKGMNTVTFLVPPIVEDTPRSGGLRTVFRMIGHLQRNNFNINIEICGEYKTTSEQQKYRIDLYNEIDDIDSIQLYFENQKTFADVYIATGWQTFYKTNYYKNKKRLVAFFCQDLEYEFGIVKLNKDCEKYTRNFYEEIIPTFTMSKFLGSYFTDNRKIASTSLNVNTDVFYLDNVTKNGICLLYDTCKKHRLPELILKLSIELAKKYPTKKIYLYGDNEMFKLEANGVNFLGALKPEETAKLYQKCELGIIFSTTNPSRIAYEMVACGTPAIEADCEYTKYDMDSDAFVRLNTDFDVIMKKIEELFNDPTEMKRLQLECEIYSNNNFCKNAEEQRFLEFVENEVMEKAPNTTMTKQTLSLRKNTQKTVSISDTNLENEM